VDYAKAQKLCTLYRGRLTRLQRAKNLQGIINLWAAMQRDFEAIDAPLPDQWRLWERASEDAQWELRRTAPMW